MTTGLLFSKIGHFIRSMAAPQPSPELEALRSATDAVGAAADKLERSANDIGRIVRDLRRGTPRKKKTAIKP